MDRLNKLEMLCKRFDVTFSITVKDNSYLIYNFGPVSWHITSPEGFDEVAFFEVSIRLAALYPKKANPKHE